MGIDAEFIAQVGRIVGDRGVITDRGEMEPYLVSWRDNWRGASPLIVRPATTEEVARVVTLCAEHRVPIVPQGGRTGVTGATQPHDDDSEIVVSTDRMNRIRAIDVDNDTMVVEAGCVLGQIRAAAEAAGRLFPLHFGAVGSCQIGGNISTNAGGINVLRYGNTRNLVAGLEVVLPDGRVWDGLRALRKDNAGYDLKQIFIGAEGTLGLITAAVIRLSPLPKGSATAFLALPSPEAALRWLTAAKARFAEALTAAELIQRLCIEVACRHIPGVSDVLGAAHPWYLLVEIAGQDDVSAMQALTSELEAGFARGEVLDGTVAASLQQAEMLWHMRETIAEAHKKEGISYKHDVSVPVSMVPTFLAEAETALEAEMPGIRMFSFGHLGDGNIHFNPLHSPGRAPQPGDLARVNRIVHDLVVALGGSISAEHGIGRLRREELLRYKSPIELEMMARLKAAFDPHNIMNPGKVVPELEGARPAAPAGRFG